MTKRVRAVLILIAACATIVLAGCDHYDCGTGATFGSSTCSASTPGIGSSGSSSGTPNAAFVFLAEARSGASGSINGYTLDTSNSTLGATANYTAPSIPTDDGGVGMVVAQKQFLYTGFGTTNQIFAWSIAADGTLTDVSGSPYDAPFMSFVPSDFGTYSVTTNPAGTLLFFSDAFEQKIFVYQIGSGGVLTAAAGSPFSVGLTPGNLATDGLGKYLYITNSSGNHTATEVGAYAIGATGALTVVPGSPFAFPMYQVQGDPTGNFLIGTTGKTVSVNGTDDDNLYVFQITQSGSSAGAIAPVAGSPFATTNAPYSIAVQTNTNGNLVYSLGLDDSALSFNPAEGYSLSSSGVLTAVTGSPFSNANVGDQGQFDQSGTFLFDFGGIFNSGDNTVVYNMEAFDIVSGGGLAEAASTLFGGGFWVATDPQ